MDIVKSQFKNILSLKHESMLFTILYTLKFNMKTYLAIDYTYLALFKSASKESSSVSVPLIFPYQLHPHSKFTQSKFHLKIIIKLQTATSFQSEWRLENVHLDFLIYLLLLQIQCQMKIPLDRTQRLLRTRASHW